MEIPYWSSSDVTSIFTKHGSLDADLRSLIEMWLWWVFGGNNSRRTCGGLSVWLTEIGKIQTMCLRLFLDAFGE